MSLFSELMTDQQLNRQITECQVTIENTSLLMSALMELKRRRSMDKIHTIVRWVQNKEHAITKNGITEVECMCGEITRYRVPLYQLSEFVCPRDPNREGKKE